MYFGSINSPMGQLPDKDVYGLHVANHQFMQAMLRYSDFAGFHFFVSNSSVKVFKKFLKKSFGKEKIFNKIKVIPFSEIKECFKKYKYLVLHNGDPFFSNYFFVRQELGLQKLPISCFVHTVSGPGAPASFLQNMIANTKNYDVMFCPTKSLAKVVEKIFKRVQEVTKITDNFKGELINIPFGIDLERFKPRNRLKVRKLLKISQKSLIIGYIGRITSWNKMDLLPFLKVFKLVLEQTKRNNVYLYFIGREQHKGYLKLLKEAAQELKISKKIKFITKHKNSQIPQYYSALDIFVSPCDQKCLALE